MVLTRVAQSITALWFAHGMWIRYFTIIHRNLSLYISIARSLLLPLTIPGSFWRLTTPGWLPTTLDWSKFTWSTFVFTLLVFTLSNQFFFCNFGCKLQAEAIDAGPIQSIYLTEYGIQITELFAGSVIAHVFIFLWYSNIFTSLSHRGKKAGISEIFT